MKQITSLQDLDRARRNKASVYCPRQKWLGPHKPAAWVINMNGSVILMMIRDGLFVYEPKTKRKPKPPREEG